jgi:Ribbon-helix-helix protein, copG family
MSLQDRTKRSSGILILLIYKGREKIDMPSRWCRLMQMREKGPEVAATKRRSSGTRITVTIPPQDYEVVRRLAAQKKVSASWIVRDAVEKYIQPESPKPTEGGLR